MNKNTVIIAASAGTVAVTLVVALTYNTLAKQVTNRFPDIDPKIARKAYKTMLTKAFAGEYGDMDDLDDAAMDAKFLLEVMKLTTK